MGAVRLRLLGRPAVVEQGHSTPLLRERRFQLLVYLAEAADWVGRDRLADLLWPDLDAGKARRNLRKTVFNARELPWAGALESDDDRLRWRVDTDLAAFTRAVREGRLADACALAQGPLLDDFDDPGNRSFSAWIDAQRAAHHQRWRNVALAALPTLPSAPERAALARRLVQSDPGDEHALLAALGVLRVDGHPTEAQGLLRDYLRHLADDHGLQPSAAVLAAARALAEPLTAVRHTAAAPLERTRRASDAFVGRRSERREVLDALATPTCRVLTLIGPGGIGKSRFARELLPDLVTLTRADVSWVAMEDLSTASQLLARIAQQLGATVNDAGDLVAQITAQRGRHATLLVLDNAEHLPELATWLQPLLTAWPLLRLVLTSRARVGLADERLLPLHGLAVPDAESRDAEAAAAFDAVHLFELRARRAQAGFELAEHLEAVITLLEMVDGLPLAIEMAADWVRLLPPAAIVRELERSIDILQRDPAAGSPAAGSLSMEAVFRRSWELLTSRQRQVLAALTVFRGGFHRDAAAAVAGAEWPLLTSLVDRSLLTLNTEGRFDMHPLVARCVAAGVSETERKALAGRHAEFYAEWLRRLEQDNAAAGPLVQALTLEYANCEAGWWAALAAERADLLDAMRPAWQRLAESQGRWREVSAMVSAALASDGVTRALPLLHVDLQLALAVLHFRLGEMDAFESTARAALAMARTVGSPRQLAAALNSVGTALERRGDHVSALPLYDEAIVQARAAGNRRLLGMVLHNAANAHREAPARRLALNEEALAVMRDIGHHDGETVMLNALGDTLHQMGDLARAREVFEMGLRLAEDRALPTRQQILRLSLGHLLIDMGEPIAARALLERAVGDAASSGQFHVEMYGQLRLARLDREDHLPQSSLQRLREVFQRARSRGFVSMALEALALHADLCAGHGAAAYARELRAWLVQAPALDAGLRRKLREQLASGATVVPPPGFDLDRAAERLAQPLEPPSLDP